MRDRRDEPDAPCDEELETAIRIWRRAATRGLLRAAWEEGTFARALRRWDTAADLTSIREAEYFHVAWRRLEQVIRFLQRSAPLHPSQLAREIKTADRILARLRSVAQLKSVPVDISCRSILFEPAG